MYAEIKSNNKILVNRLDDSERILLKDICDRANESDKEVKVNAITDECGDFGGIFIEVQDKEQESNQEENEPVIEQEPESEGG